MYSFRYLITLCAQLQMPDHTVCTASDVCHAKVRSPHVSHEQHKPKLLFDVSKGVSFATWLPAHSDTQQLCTGPAKDSFQRIKQNQHRSSCLHETSNLLHSHLLMLLAHHVDQQQVFWNSFSTFAAVLLITGSDTIVFTAAL